VGEIQRDDLTKSIDFTEDCSKVDGRFRVEQSFLCISQCIYVFR
jgi:hypothetical protein